MKTHVAICTAAVVALSTVAGAQQQAGSTDQRPAASAKPNEVAVIGCLQRESDFRAQTNAGRGGVLGSGLGTGNEYVLANAVPADTSRNSRMRPQPAAPASGSGTNGPAVGTSGAARHYSLTGKLEENLLRDVGRLVEIVGPVEESKSADALPRLTISVWHPVGDFCPATK